MDGPGIRIAVFMSGCNLRCAYCHNPDTWVQGKKVGSEELFSIIMRYKPYFKNGGGVTFTGGEPILQAEFLIETINMLKKEDINVILDTSISILGESQKKMYDLCDLVIADLKFPNGKMYLQYCGNDTLGTVKDTLCYLNEKNIPVWIRTVIIPDVNDSKEYIDKYYSIIKNYNNITKYELKPFHTMGFEKYEKLNIHNPLKDKVAMDEEKLDILKIYLKGLNGNK